MQRLVIHPTQMHTSTIHLSDQQEHYLSRVLRLKPGDRFVALDGQGSAWIVQLTQSQQGEILESINLQPELPVALHLVVALPKGNGFDEIVRQATELGVSAIIPVISDRTLLNPSAQKVERWRRITQEAAEQAERSIVPPVPDPIPWPAHLAALGDRAMPQHQWLCVTRIPAPHLLRVPHPPPDTPHPITIAIGPEGGWAEPEITAAIAVGYQPVSLGSRILRTVTAPLVAIALLAAQYEQNLLERNKG